MPKLDGSGPEKDKKSNGRGFGYCSQLPLEEVLPKLGVGMGKKRKSGYGEGKGKRLKYFL